MSFLTTADPFKFNKIKKSIYFVVFHQFFALKVIKTANDELHGKSLLFTQSTIWIYDKNFVFFSYKWYWNHFTFHTKKFEMLNIQLKKSV